MATTTTSSQQATLAGLPPATRAKSRISVAGAAFVAILNRDIVVTGRDFIAFLLQVLLQPLFFLFIFGKVLPSIGFAQRGFAAVLLPGIVALTVVTTALQGVTLPLVLDLGFAREIDDRLLAPLPVSLVAVEKVLFAAMRGLVAGAIIFPLAWWILGDQYSVRTDAIGVIIGIMILTAFAGACLGLTIGTSVKPEQIGLMFSLIFTPLIFTGCTYYPWGSLDSIKWFQIITLFNPLTYAAEGLRYAMVPTINGHTLPTLAMGWVILGLSVTIVVFFILGLRIFRRRVIN
ncbi:MAG TPA: ABC transporter permease [Ktedonobacteraceae bacterium]|jgi:ABC-2 type transport system permease protein|nr:ABC transporter permease [Ktedonobacteraceae bacterium]